MVYIFRNINIDYIQSKIIMVKSFDCSKCGGFHPRPINRNCKEPKVNAETASMDTNSQILHELKNLSSRMSQIEDKV